MNKSDYTVLVVDDEEFNLELIEAYLNSAGLSCQCVSGGSQALDLIERDGDNYSCVLLDRMMPEMDGIEVLKKIKSNQHYNRLPIIMQTAMTSSDNVREGLEAGAYYYLTKPYDEKTLIAIVSAAINDYIQFINLQKSLKDTTISLQMMKSGCFILRTLEQAKTLAVLLAKTCPNADNVVIGLSELLINSIEHGNLNISYREKTQLNKTNSWQHEVTSRLALEQYRDRDVIVEFERKSNKLSFTILDQGDGFDWSQYMVMSKRSALNTHGRGIAMANLISFDEMEYRGNGSEVQVTVFI